MGVGKELIAKTTSPVLGFWSGFRYPFRGFLFLLRNLQLVRFWVWPILITTACLLLVGYGASHLHEDLLEIVWEPPRGEG